MKLERVHIDQFGKLSQVDFSFDSGFQVLYSSNEAGKSTLLQFLRAIFYGVGDRRGQDKQNSRDRYRPWEGGLWGGYVVYEDKGQRLRLTRHFGDTKAKDRLRLNNEVTGEELEAFWGQAEQPGEALFGLSVRSFGMTCFVGQAPEERSWDEDKEGQLSGRLKQIVGSLEEGVSSREVNRRLTEAELQLRSKSGRAGSLTDLETEQQELRTKLQEWAELGERQEEIQQRVREAEALAQEQMKLCEAAQEQIDRVRELEAREQELQRREANLEQQERWQRSYQDARVALLNLGCPADGEVEQAGDLLRRRVEEKRRIVEENRMRVEAAQSGLLQEASRLSELTGEGLVPAVASHLQKTPTVARDPLQVFVLTEVEEGNPPWLQYEAFEEERQALETEKARWDGLAALRQTLVDKRVLRREAEEAVNEAQTLHEQASLAYEQQQRNTISAEIRCKNAEQERVQQEAAYSQESNRLETRKRERNLELERRKKAYNKRLRHLVQLSVGFGLFSIPAFAASYFWAETALSRQAFVFLGLLCLIGCAIFGVHRSIFPPAEPTLVSDPDAERLLEQSLQQVKRLRVWEAQTKEELQSHTQEREQARLRQEQAAQQLAQAQAERNLAEENNTAAVLALDACEKTFKPVPSPEELQKEQQRLTGLLEEVEARQQRFCDQYGIASREAFYDWKGQCLVWVQEQKGCLEATERACVRLIEAVQQQRLALHALPQDLPHWPAEDVVLPYFPEWREDGYVPLCNQKGLPLGHALWEDYVAAAEPPKLSSKLQMYRANVLLQYGLELFGRTGKIVSSLQSYEECFTKALQELRHAGEMTETLRREGGGESLVNLRLLCRRESSRWIADSRKEHCPPAFLEQPAQEGGRPVIRFADWLATLRRTRETCVAEERAAHQRVEQERYAYLDLFQGKRPQRELEEELAAVEEESGRQQRYLRLLGHAKSWLASAEEQLQSTLAPKINDATAVYLAELTGSRYQQAYVSPGLSIKLDASASATMKEGSLFSAGTQDQAYFALRLAISDLLDEDKDLPLLCDDPFTNYDQERMLAAMKLLARMGREGRQILLVTCHPAPNGFIPETEGASWHVWQQERPALPAAGPIHTESVPPADFHLNVRRV